MTGRRRRLRAESRLLAVLLAIGLLYSQGLALLHGVLHVPGRTAGATAAHFEIRTPAPGARFAGPVAAVHGLHAVWRHGHDHSARAALASCDDEPARDHGWLVALVERLLGSHEDQGPECRLYDQASHADALLSGGAPGIEPPPPDPAPPCERAGPVPLGSATVRNRGPPRVT